MYIYIPKFCDKDQSHFQPRKETFQTLKYRELCQVPKHQLPTHNKELSSPDPDKDNKVSHIIKIVFDLSHNLWQSQNL